EWSKDKRIPELILAFSGRIVNPICGRYQPSDDFYQPYKVISSLRHICDRIREVYDKCEIETLYIFPESLFCQPLYRKLIVNCARIRCTKDMEIF
ncbi:hypothetical protein PFISCL1PPCAC_21867, partial [Pristionchus fissidentatus]